MSGFAAASVGVIARLVTEKNAALDAEAALRAMLTTAEEQINRMALSNGKMREALLAYCVRCGVCQGSGMEPCAGCQWAREALK